ncbi:MAG TPA: tol-pal system protein YbgF [Arenimonas sp.]|uniref:tol-pal system protein YbgF n=1 Tax=Arenimonas sp. TaxID=1872635 RepID=UPI002C695C6E|nr:tol-pal system protein YbgF [Arenimonas sp.]HMB57897.1 tol-pal system protein YbgF [Arenimonas sp.]
MPAVAQKQSLADRVARLEQQSSTQTQSSGQANVDLLNRLTQLQTEVASLRGLVEQLQNENAQLKQGNRDQYIDLDSRLQRLESGGAHPAATGPRPPAATTPAAAGKPATKPSATTSTPAAADEQAAYGSAFNSLKQGDYVESARGFKAYLDAYPQGALAPNAWYWLGESYYVTQNYPIAQQAFETLLSQFPDSGKVPDALLKKGYCQIELKQVDAGQQTLNRVISTYPDSDAARLAQSRLRALSLETR